MTDPFIFTLAAQANHFHKQMLQVSNRFKVRAARSGSLYFALLGGTIPQVTFQALYLVKEAIFHAGMLDFELLFTFIQRREVKEKIALNLYPS